jgi:hypothetical protein
MKQTTEIQLMIKSIIYGGLLHIDLKIFEVILTLKTKMVFLNSAFK